MERERLEREEEARMLAARLGTKRIKRSRILNEQQREEEKARRLAEERARLLKTRRERREREEEARRIREEREREVAKEALEDETLSLSGISCSPFDKEMDVIRLDLEVANTILACVGRSISKDNVTPKTEPGHHHIARSMSQDNGTSGVTRVGPGSQPTTQTATAVVAVSTSNCNDVAFKPEPVDNSDLVRQVSLNSGASNTTAAAVGGSVYSSMSRIE